MEELLNKIKDLMVEKDLTSVDFPTYEWNPNPDSEADCGNGEYLVRYKSSYEDTQFWNTYVRRVKLVDGELVFDLQEVYEDSHDNYEELDWYSDQKINPQDFDPDLLENALKSVLWVLENQ